VVFDISDVEALSSPTVILVYKVLRIVLLGGRIGPTRFETLVFWAMTP
jgi:hypothetical protein